LSFRALVPLAAERATAIPMTTAQTSEGEEVPAWVRRWSSKLPEKLRTFVSEANSEAGPSEKSAPTPPPPVYKQHADGRAHVPPVTRTVSEGLGVGASASSTRDELEAERTRRLGAEQEARLLSAEVWSLKAEVARMHEMMRRLDTSSLGNPTEAEAACDMFLRLAREAHNIGENMRASGCFDEKGPAAAAPSDVGRPPSPPSATPARAAVSWRRCSLCR